MQVNPCTHSSTAILSETSRISSELRSQATAGLVSTTVGDHVGIRGAVGSFLANFSVLQIYIQIYIQKSPCFFGSFASAKRRRERLQTLQTPFANEKGYPSFGAANVRCNLVENRLAGVATRTQKWGVRGSLGAVKSSPRKNCTLELTS